MILYGLNYVYSTYILLAVATTHLYTFPTPPFHTQYTHSAACPCYCSIPPQQSTPIVPVVSTKLDAISTQEIYGAVDLDGITCVLTSIQDNIYKLVTNVQATQLYNCLILNEEHSLPLYLPDTCAAVCLSTTECHFSIMS